MRMRRKKNLDSRFESVKKSWIEIDKTELNASVIKEESEHICFEEIFGNKTQCILKLVVERAVLRLKWRNDTQKSILLVLSF